MKKLIIAAALVAVSGCQTRITAEKNPEQMLPIYRAAIAGTNVVTYVSGYERATGGWYATARSPLWADEALKNLSIGVHTNGSVTLSLAEYHRDLSTNAVVMTQIMVDGAVKLTEKVAAAIVSAGGSTAASGVQSAISSLVAKYISAGGDADNATVTCKDGTCTISDGNVTCTDGSCMDK